MKELTLLDVLKHKNFEWSKTEFNRVKESLRNVVLDMTGQNMEVSIGSKLDSCGKI